MWLYTSIVLNVVVLALYALIYSASERGICLVSRFLSAVKHMSPSSVGSRLHSSRAHA